MELADQSEPRAAAAVLLFSCSFFLLSHMHKQGSGLARIISRPAPASGAFFFLTTLSVHSTLRSPSHSPFRHYLPTLSTPVPEIEDWTLSRHVKQHLYDVEAHAHRP